MTRSQTLNQSPFLAELTGMLTADMEIINLLFKVNIQECPHALLRSDYRVAGRMLNLLME